MHFRFLGIHTSFVNWPLHMTCCGLRAACHLWLKNHETLFLKQRSVTDFSSQSRNKLFLRNFSILFCENFLKCGFGNTLSILSSEGA